MNTKKESGVVGDKFLLFKPYANMTYIRKLSMSYGYYTALAVVDSNDCITHIGLDNTFQILAFNELVDDEKELLAINRKNELKKDDLLSVYHILKAVQLDKPIRLKKHFTNMRYTNAYETFEVKKSIIRTLKENHEGDVISYYDANLHSSYGESISLDVDNIDLSEPISDDGEVLPKGQVTLI